MNEYIKAAAKFERNASIVFIVFFIITLFLVPVLVYIFKNIWLFLGILFSFLGYTFKDRKPEKIFFLVSIAIVIYWFSVGFRFSDSVTFCWFSYLFGSVCKAFIIGFEDLAKKIQTIMLIK
jgi:hypothetical protein